jgi:ribonuclease P protein component
MFVKKIYEEGKAKDSNYEFKQALKDASKRKSEMGHSASASGVKKAHKRSRTAKRSRSATAAMAGGRKSRRHRRHRR